jgi:uncharacterized protein (UPF0332 family)
MDYRDYLTLAVSLAAGSTEAEWRAAVSRAYYAAFHVARELLLGLRFRVPHADRAHAYLWLRLANAGVADVQLAGNRLNALRHQRNRADYSARPSLLQTTAVNEIRNAQNIIQALDAAAVDPVRTKITDAMRVYERDVLRDATWHP